MIEFSTTFPVTFPTALLMIIPVVLAIVVFGWLLRWEHQSQAKRNEVIDRVRARGTIHLEKRGPTVHCPHCGACLNEPAAEGVAL